MSASETSIRERRTDQAWREEAQRLRADGMSYRKIAARLGRDYHSVRRIFVPEWYAAQEKERRAYKRAWEQKGAPCERCGGPMHSRTGTRGQGICQVCFTADRETQRRERRSRIAEMWQAGASIKEIAAGLDSTANSIGVEIVRMREDGYDLPYRHRRPNPKHPEQLVA